MLQPKTALASPGERRARMFNERMARRAYLAFVAALWALTIVGIFVKHPMFAMATATLLAGFIAASLVTTTWENWLPSVVILAAIVVLVLVDGSWGDVEARLNESLNLLALLGTLQFVRLVAQRDPRMHGFRRQIMAQPLNRRPAWLLLASNLFGSVLGSGSTAALSSTLHIRADMAVRRASAIAVIAGCSLSTAWSPVFVSIAIVTSYAPATPVWQTILVGMGLTVIGMTTALWIIGIERPFRAAGQAVRAAAPLLPLIAAAGLAVVLLSSLGLNTMEATSLALPPLALVLMLTYGKSARSRVYGVARVPRLALLGVARSNGEIAMLALAFVLARLMGTSPAMADAVTAIGIANLPGFLSIPTVAFAILLVAPFGAHPMIVVSIVLAVLAPQDASIPQPFVLAAALLGWSAAAMISFTGFLVVISTRLFDLKRLDMILGSNLKLALIYTLVGTAYLMTLAAMFAP